MVGPADGALTQAPRANRNCQTPDFAVLRWIAGVEDEADPASCEARSQVLRWKETRKLTSNLTLHYGRVLYVVDESPAALSARGKQVEVHELEDGSVSFWFRSAELTATPFRKDGCVRQRDIDDNKLLGPLLAQLRDQQIARDEARLPKLRTLRERRALEASIAERRAPTTP